MFRHYDKIKGDHKDYIRGLFSPDRGYCAAGRLFLRGLRNMKFLSTFEIFFL